MAHHFGAFDLGAESGRFIVGSLDKQRLRLKEVRRFPTGMLKVAGCWRWNIFGFYSQMKSALQAYAAKSLPRLDSIGIDTWGVDYALLDKSGRILELPYSYRDSRTRGMMPRFFRKIPAERVYRMTGIQFMPFNTLFQLLAMKQGRSALFKDMRCLLFMPDIFNYFLTGRKRTEFTFATTSQLYNPVKRDWEPRLFRALGIPRSIMQKAIAPGTIIGPIKRDICAETGINPMPVIAPATHDTASAIVAVPATQGFALGVAPALRGVAPRAGSDGPGWAYISSGTWSLMGIEVSKPILTDKAWAYNFTNEGGACRTFRFLKNITGLWLIQQCAKSWRRNDYGRLIEQAARAPAFKALVNPDWPEFLNPPDMPEAIRRFCKKTKQSAPKSPAQMTRCILESLALQYRLVLEQLKELSPRPINTIHIIGGGARNGLLCQFTADATGLPVLAGPVEATAIGNIMMQALALGYVKSLAEIREVVRNSFKPARYAPRHNQGWDEAYKRFKKLSK